MNFSGNWWFDWLNRSQDADKLVFDLSFGVGMEVGQKVRVRRLRDRVNGEIVNKLGQIGIIQDYKMTDGSGVGWLVQFDDKFSTWFFEDEIELA